MYAKLQLQRLKDSTSRKKRKIYEKAQRIIRDGHTTEDLTESEIMKVAEKFPSLDVRVLYGDNITVKSKKDSWFIRDEGKFYSLYHKAFKLDKGKLRDTYHIQDVFVDLDFVLASIVSHDDFSILKIRRHMGEVAELAEQGQVMQ